MKEAIFIIGALALSALVTRAADIRIIGGRAVDLQPIHDWEERGKEGERPLKHWQEIQVVGWVTQGPHGHPVATITISNGPPREVWLKNCPKQVIADLARVAELEQQEVVADQQARYAANWAEAARNRPVWGGYLAATDPAILNAWAAREQANAAAAINLAAAAEKISNELGQLRAKLAKEGKVLAMDTGLDYASEDIWDTGLVRGR